MGDLGKLIVAKGFKKLSKSNKLPNLVTLLGSHDLIVIVQSSSLLRYPWQVVVAQLLEQSRPNPEVRGLNPVIGNFLLRTQCQLY